MGNARLDLLDTQEMTKPPSLGMDPRHPYKDSSKPRVGGWEEEHEHEIKSPLGADGDGTRAPPWVPPGAMAESDDRIRAPPRVPPGVVASWRCESGHDLVMECGPGRGLGLMWLTVGRGLDSPYVWPGLSWRWRGCGRCLDSCPHRGEL